MKDLSFYVADYVFAIDATFHRIAELKAELSVLEAQSKGITSAYKSFRKKHSLPEDNFWEDPDFLKKKGFKV